MFCKSSLFFRFIFPSQPNSSMSSTVLHSVLLYMQPLFLFYRFQVSHFHCVLLNLKDKFLLSAFQHVGLPFLHDTCNNIFCCHSRVPAVFVVHVASVTGMASCIDFRCYNKATKRNPLQLHLAYADQQKAIISMEG